jgi:hypothetical protein
VRYSGPYRSPVAKIKAVYPKYSAPLWKTGKGRSTIKYPTNPNIINIIGVKVDVKSWKIPSDTSTSPLIGTIKIT